MAIVALAHPMAWPGLSPTTSGGPTTGALGSLDAAGEYDAFIFEADRNMVASHVGFVANTATGSPTVTISIETVDAAGLPSGILWATDTSVTTGTVVAGAWGLHQLTAPATILRGELFCVKFAYASGTAVALRSMGNVRWAESSLLPYRVQNVGTPTKAAANSGFFALGSSTTSFYPLFGIMPLVNLANTTFTTGRRGLRFKVPFKCQCDGLRWRFGATATDYEAAIYSDGGDKLTSISGEGNSTSLVSGPVANVFFPPITLEIDTWYRATVEGSGGTATPITEMTLPSVDYKSALRGGANQHITYYSGTWNDASTTILPMMDVLIRGLNAG